MKKGFEWRGVDGFGFKYGFYHDGGKAYRLDISIPGAGQIPLHKGPGHKLSVDGSEVGTAATLAEGQAFLERFCREGLHRKIGREEPRGLRGASTLRWGIHRRKEPRPLIEAV